MVKRARRDLATTAVVRLVGVQVRYRGGPVVVFGANGSGKSTLLRVVAECTSPSAGTVTGRPRAVGFVPDRFPSQLQMPARNYLRHMAALHRRGAGGAPGQDAAR
ncbi:MAG TPA: ATP-binding cassette domain-containing protein [Pseudonocardiaceae bacterium]|jgi:ABC-type Mn2+/Zn2+ transport system ATPase subunit